jgi:MFS family permease
VGEASYASVAPSLIADYFPPERRATPIGAFNAAIPVGAALGLILGGLLGEYFGWRSAFFIVGLPGVALAVVAYLIREPARGAMDVSVESADGALLAPHAPPNAVEGYLRLVRIPVYTLSVLGYSAMTFAFGALAYWGPQLLQADKGMTEKEAGLAIGLVALVGGMVGTLAGGVLADRLLRRTKNAYALVCAVTAALAAPPMAVAIASARPAVFLPAMFAAVLISFMGNAPVNAIIVNAAPAELRVSAVALSILSIHVLGDAVSQPAVGALSDRIATAGPALPATVASLARLAGLDPAAQHLSLALLVLPVAMLVAAVFFVAAARTSHE